MTAAFLVYILIVILVAGVAIMLVKKAPFIDGDLKAFATFAIGAVAIILVIIRALQVLAV